MSRPWFLAGLALFLGVGLVLFPVVIGVPWTLFFSHDALAYSMGAVHLLRDGFYSFDGVHPFMDREPLMSFFLVPVYAFFGAENAYAVALAQGVLVFLASTFFADRLATQCGSRAAGLCFVIVLTSGSVFHAIYSGYRECIVLILLLFFCGLWLDPRGRRRESVLMGLCLGGVILGYLSFLLLPPFLLALWWMQRRPLADGLLMLAVSGAVVGAWGIRNASYDGHFRIVDSRRAAVMWYVRGEQAELVHGLEPLRCLWAEYISRDWTGRSPACSFNALMHAKWPEGFDVARDYSDTEAVSKRKIAAHIGSYLWFSVFEILELHLPYVGGGWSTAFNVYAAVTQFFLGIGFLCGIAPVFRTKPLWILLLVIGYNTGIFILTDATPRYLLPVFFAYAAVAGIGYHSLLKRCCRQS